LGSSFQGAADAANTGASVIKTGNDLKTCYSSIKGQESTIASAYKYVTSNPSSTSVSQVASAFKSGLSYFSGLDPTAQATLYQLLVVYLDKRANGDSATTAGQQAAYKAITPDCDTAFQELTNLVDEGKSAAGLVDNNNTTCKNFAQQFSAGQVNVTLCQLTTQWSNQGQWYYNVTAMFSNYGTQLCNLTFYIDQLDKAVTKSPSWLPFTNLAYPTGVPTGTNIVMTASIPYDINSNTKTPAPTVEVLNNLYLCPPEAAPVATPKPTTGGTPQATQNSAEQMYNEILNSDKKCFLTDECIALVAPFQNDQCEALRQVFSSQCYECSTSVLASAQSDCLKACSADYCMPKASAIKATSGASTIKLSSVILALVMGAAAMIA